MVFRATCLRTPAIRLAWRCTTLGLFPGNSPELGLMLITNGDRGTGNRGGATQPTEALLFRTP